MSRKWYGDKTPPKAFEIRTKGTPPTIVTGTIAVINGSKVKIRMIQSVMSEGGEIVIKGMCEGVL